MRALVAGLAFAVIAAGCQRDVPRPSTDGMSGAWTSVTVGVGDLDVALDLWVETFGMNVVARYDGGDLELARLWDIDPLDIHRQALVRTGSSKHGMIHFIEWSEPGDAVRENANVFDRVPKNLDVYVDDMPARLAELRQRGLAFRSDDYSEVTAPDGTAFREIHMPSHDAINVVLLEVLGKSRPFSERGFAAVGPLIFIVADAEAEKAFFRDVIGLDKLNDNILKGPEIERMVGLPPGAGLDVSIWGRVGQAFGEIEIIEYQGVTGSDLYPRARPPARGILHVSYVVDDLAPILSRLERHAVEVRDHGRASTLIGNGRVVSFSTPAGLRIEVYETR